MWIGADAYKLGLVDKLGTFRQALDSAAKLAKLDEHYKVRYFRQVPSLQQKLMTKMLSNAQAEAPVKAGDAMLNPFTRVMQVLTEQLRRMAQFNDPNGVYAYWLEEVNF